MVKPKNGPKEFELNDSRIGRNIDITNGVQRDKRPKNIKGPQSRKKAVAIKDSDQSSTMPRVIASGQGSLAEQILHVAWANNIKVREDADLIEVLSAIDIDSEIPIEAFAAIAEILTYVYRANSGEIPIHGLKENQ